MIHCSKTKTNTKEIKKNEKNLFIINFIVAATLYEFFELATCKLFLCIRRIKLFKKKTFMKTNSHSNSSQKKISLFDEMSKKLVILFVVIEMTIEFFKNEGASSTNWLFFDFELNFSFFIDFTFIIFISSFFFYFIFIIRNERLEIRKGEKKSIFNFVVDDNNLFAINWRESIKNTLIYRQLVEKNCHFSIDFISFFLERFHLFFQDFDLFQSAFEIQLDLFCDSLSFFQSRLFFFKKLERINMRFSSCFHFSNAFDLVFFNKNRKRSVTIASSCEFTHDFFHFSSMSFRKLFKSSAMTIRKRSKWNCDIEKWSKKFKNLWKKAKSMSKVFRKLYDDFETKKTRFHENKQIREIMKTK